MFEIASANIKQGDCAVYPEVVAEVVYVLKSVYKVDRIDISDSVICFLDEVISERKEAIIKGLSLFAETTLDFVDCLLIAYHECYGYDVLTFDKSQSQRQTLSRKLKKFLTMGHRTRSIGPGKADVVYETYYKYYKQAESAHLCDREFFSESEKTSHCPGI